MVTGFIELLETVTASNYSAIANSHNPQFITARTNSYQSAVPSPVIAWQRLPMPQLPQFLCSRPYWPATASHLTKQHIGRDRTDNTASNNSIVAKRSYCTDPAENTA
jgi:hypothetical protein